jgi:hypothetical protein
MSQRRNNIRELASRIVALQAKARALGVSRMIASCLSARNVDCWRT